MAIDPETGLETGVDPETGLPMTVGTGNIVDPSAAGSDVMSEAGTMDDPYYDPNALEMFDDIEDAPNIDQIGEEDDIEMPEMAMGPQSQETAIGTSSSFRGITDAGKKQSDKFFGAAQTRADAKGGILADQFAQDSARVNANIDKRKQLAQELAGYDQEHQDELLDIRRAQRDHHLKQAKLEEMAWNKSMQGATQYIAQYKQEMAGVRQMMLQTGNPLGGLTAVEGGALGAALFAQGFLGARGIQVNVAGQVDRWVEREMAAHQQKIQNTTNAAESNLTLYNLARQGAMDDVMARQRMRGFVLDALKSSIYMEAARYKSQSALADAQMKAAELDALALQNEMAMRDKLVKNQMDIYDKEILAAKYAADASTTAWSTAIDAKYKDRMAAVAEREKPEKPEKPSVSPDLKIVEDPGRPIYDDNGKIVGYEAGWELPEMPDTMFKETHGEIAKKNAGYREVLKALEDIRTLKANYKDVADTDLGIAKLTNPRARQYRVMFHGAIQKARHAIAGANLTGFEKGEWDQYYGFNNTLELGDNSFALDALEQNLRNAFVAEVESRGGRALNQEGVGKGTNTKMSTTDARTQANVAKEREVSPVAAAEGRAGDIDRSVPTGESGSKLYLMYVAASGGRDKRTGDEGPIGVSTAVAQKVSPSQVGYDAQVDRLAKMGATAARDNDDQTLTQVRLALTRLQKNSGYAQFALDMLDAQPEAVVTLTEE